MLSGNYLFLQYITLSNEPNTKGQQDQSWNLCFMLRFYELDVTLWLKFHRHLQVEIKGPTTCCACRPALHSKYSKSFQDNKIKPSVRKSWLDSLILTLERPAPAPLEMLKTSGKLYGYQVIIKTGSGHFPQFNNHCLYSNYSLSPLAMLQIISAIGGMNLQSGFAYCRSEPQPDIGRTSQTRIHDLTQIFFLVSFTAPSGTIATRPTNVMQIHCVAMPLLCTCTYIHTYTHPYTHTHRSTHRWLLRPWQFQLWMKAVNCPCINGFKRGLEAKTSVCSQSLPPSSLPLCQLQEIPAQSSNKNNLFPPQRQKLTKLFVNMESKMKPWAQEWTGRSIILNIRWQERYNKASSEASTVPVMWWVQLHCQGSSA